MLLNVAQSSDCILSRFVQSFSIVLSLVQSYSTLFSVGRSYVTKFSIFIIILLNYVQSCSI